MRNCSHWISKLKTIDVCVSYEPLYLGTRVQTCRTWVEFYSSTGTAVPEYVPVFFCFSFLSDSICNPLLKSEPVIPSASETTYSLRKPFSPWNEHKVNTFLSIHFPRNISIYLTRTSSIVSGTQYSYRYCFEIIDRYLSV